MKMIKNEKCAAEYSHFDYLGTKIISEKTICAGDGTSTVCHVSRICYLKFVLNTCNSENQNNLIIYYSFRTHLLNFASYAKFSFKKFILKKL